MKTGKILKFICGAGNENFEEIKKLSFIYASAGFNMIDTSAKIESVNAVNFGIKRAGKENNTDVCISLGLNDDIHFAKAYIEQDKCSHCGKCLLICRQSAIFNRCGQFFVEEKNCIGCKKCVDSCESNAIFTKNKNGGLSVELNDSLLKNVDCIEFHCSSNNKSQILETWNKLTLIYKGKLSICMNRSKLGDDDIISLLKQMTLHKENVIIQADGISMSGGANDYKSNLQTVAFCELLRNSGIKSTLILSGGTNEKTSEFAKLCKVDIDGIAVGSFARNLVYQYVKNIDFWENSIIQKKAIDKANNLAEKLLKA